MRIGICPRGPGMLLSSTLCSATPSRLRPRVVPFAQLCRRDLREGRPPDGRFEHLQNDRCLVVEFPVRRVRPSVDQNQSDYANKCDRHAQPYENSLHASLLSLMSDLEKRSQQAVQKCPYARRTKHAPAKAGVHVTMRRTPYAAATEPAPPKAGGMSATPQMGVFQRPANRFRRCLPGNGTHPGPPCTRCRQPTRPDDTWSPAHHPRRTHRPHSCRCRPG